MEIKLINICYPVRTTSNHHVSPEEFLSWAKSDLKGGDRRAMGNALSNIKKTIHSRIDEILALSHLSFSKDWNSRATTDDKIALLKKLNIEHTSIVRVISNIRNTYEHQYILPPHLTDIRAYYETTELWLNHSINSLISCRLGLINLPVYAVECDSNRIIQAIEFPRYVENFNIVYFWENKKTIAILTKDNRDLAENMKDQEMARYVELEKKHIKISDKRESYYLTPGNLTKIFKACRRTMQKRMHGFNIINPRLELN
jgi:hypothetical protein